MGSEAVIICIVCDVLGEANNGTTLAALDLIGALRERGHTVRVVCPDEDKKDLPDYYVVGRKNLGPFNHYVHSNGVHLASGTDMETVKKAFEGTDVVHFNFCGVIAKPEKGVLGQALDGADHVHLMTPFPLCRTALRMAKKRGLSVTAGFHCQAENITSHLGMKNVGLINRLVYRLFYRNFFRYVDGVHYPTEFIRRLFDHYGGKTNAYVISNGVNSAFRSREPKRPTGIGGIYKILFTGRYAPEKSHPKRSNLTFSDTLLSVESHASLKFLPIWSG